MERGVHIGMVAAVSETPTLFLTGMWTNRSGGWNAFAEALVGERPLFDLLLFWEGALLRRMEAGPAGAVVELLVNRLILQFIMCLK